MKINICLIMLIIIVTSCTSKTKQNNITAHNKSFELLANAGAFGFRHADGQTFRETDDAYQLLITSKTAKEIFIHLFEKGNTIGKLYALCALYKLDKNIFNDLSNKINKKETVYTQFGCVFDKELIETILLGFVETESKYQP